VIVIGHLFGGERFVAESRRSIGGVNLCDNTDHGLQLTIVSQPLSLTVASETETWDVQLDDWQITNGDVYLGGAPGRELRKSLIFFRIIVNHCRITDVNNQLLRPLLTFFHTVADARDTQKPAD